MEPTVIQFFAAGIPKAQPRVRAFARKMGNKFVARVYDAGTAENWKGCIALAARTFVPPTPLSGPLKVSITFFMPRPKSHYRTGKHAGELRPDAPTWHAQKPDRDNLEKAVLDCLTAISMWQDDGQVCSGPVDKCWTIHNGKPGALITIETTKGNQ